MSSRQWLQRFALDHGWGYRERHRALAERWCGPPFTAARRSALDAITGVRQGIPIAAFRLVTDQSRGYLVVAAALRGPLPRVSLVPLENAVDGRPYGESFEPEDELLADRYQIAAVDFAAANALLHLAGVTLLRRLPPLDWRIEGSDLLLLQHDDDAALDIADSIDAVVEMASHIPPEAYAEYVPVPEFPPPRTTLGPPPLPDGTAATAGSDGTADAAGA